MKKDLEEMQKRTRKLLLEKAGLSPQEDYSNSNTIAPTTQVLIWRPNNYRREITIKPNFYLNNSAEKELQTTIDSTYKGQKTKVHISKHNKIITISNFQGVIIQIAKKKMTAILPQVIIDGEKQHYRIEGNTLEEIEEWLTFEKDKRRDLLDDSIFKISKLFGLELPYTRCKWQRYEDFLRGDEFLDNIPAHAIIHHRIGKKAYATGWEWHSTGDGEEPTANMINYIKERSLEKHRDTIVNELAGIKEMVKGQLEIARATNEFVNQNLLALSKGSADLAYNMRTHVKIMKEIKNGMRDFNKLLKPNKELFLKGELITPPDKEDDSILTALKNNIKCLDDLPKADYLVKKLSPQQLTSFQVWIFERFGI